MQQTTTTKMCMLTSNTLLASLSN